MYQEAAAQDKSGTVPAERSRFSPEFHLLLLCLQWPPSALDLRQIAAASQGDMDWQHFLALLRRHRVAGLAARALRRAGVSLPAEAAASLQTLASATAMQAMALSVESLRLQRLLLAHGVDAVFLKGSALAVLACGELSVRHSKDVDLLVPVLAVAQTVQALRQGGYQPSLDIEHLSADRQTLWFRYSKAMDWTHAETGAQLELHWRMTDLPLLQDVFATGQRQAVALTGGQQLQTLAPDALLAYLCVHGAMHGWMRLKWLADVYALLPHDADACEQTYRRLLQLQAGRSAGQALLLCHDLFDLPLPRRLLRELESSPVLKYLRRSALRLLQRGGEVEEVDDLPFGTTTVYLSRLLLGGGMRQLLLELRTWAFRPDALLTSRLPRPFFFLFPLVRIGGWLRERLRHGGRSPQPRGSNTN